MLSSRKPLRSSLFALCFIFCLIEFSFSSCAPLLAQTMPAQMQNMQSSPGKSQLSPDGQTTTATVANQYDDAVATMAVIDRSVPVNQTNINNGVQRMLSGYRTPLVFQSAEQGVDGELQKAANSLINANAGAVNDTYRGMHQWYTDDLVSNLFPNIGQLVGKFLTEFLDGWVSDAAQFLSRILRVFVLNPNIAVNGLDGEHNDGVSNYIRQGADVMYKIAVDLSLLFFILCIWKFWAEAAVHGRANVMSAVGRLIFTVGLLIAWPTIYAFDVQITNEMIQAIVSSPEQVQHLDAAMAVAVKSGVLAAGSGVLGVLAPVAAKLNLGYSGNFVGAVFSFGATLVYSILAMVLITELVYVMVLKAIQTALLTAQYMFAPVFLVCFATPDTESYATGFVTSFVETSLWSFIWVGLLKVMTLIMFSNFSPWGKLLIAVGVLQIMIQVPAFLSKAQISPTSDFLTPKLLFKALSSSFSGLETGVNGLVNNGVALFTNGRYDGVGLQQTKNAGLGNLPGATSNPELLNSLNKVMQGGSGNVGGGPPQMIPPVMTRSTGSGRGSATGSGSGAVDSVSVAGVNNGFNSGGGIKGGGKRGGSGSGNIPPQNSKPSSGNNLGIDFASSGSVNVSTNAASKNLNSGNVSISHGKMSEDTGASSSAAGSFAGDVDSNGAADETLSTVPHNSMHGDGDSREGGMWNSQPYRWARSSAEGWDSGNLCHVDARKLLARLTSVEGVGLRVGQERNSVLGSAAHGVQRVNIAKDATPAEMANGIYAAAFAHNIATDDPARDAARKAAIKSGGAGPRGLAENLSANWLNASGVSWQSTAIAKERFQQSMFGEAVEGSQAYVSGMKGNDYTSYLCDRYGPWGPDQDAEAVHLISNPESSESPWNRNVGPATESLVVSGIPIDKDTRAAMQNLAIQSMHPSRRKQAVFAALSYTHARARREFGNEHPSVFKLAHGDMARNLPAQEVNNALAVYQISGENDLSSPIAPSLMSSAASLAASHNVEFSTAYKELLREAPIAAQRCGYVSAAQAGSAGSFNELASAVHAANRDTNTSMAMKVILFDSISALNSRGFVR